jgi:hypothetical protein
VLEIDHVIPVVDGGGDNEENLVTACFDCNRGKAAESLTCIPSSISDRVEQERERLEQVKAFNAYGQQLRQEVEEQSRRLGTYWCNATGRDEDRDQFTFGDARMRSVMRFLKDLGPHEIQAAMDIALAKKDARAGHDDGAFRYFCGTCWGMIKERKDGR